MARALTVHVQAFADDLAKAGMPRAWTALPAVALLHLVETVGVKCDGVSTIVRAPALLPTHCCCRLDTFRTEKADQARVVSALSQHLSGWMKAMADDDGMGTLWTPPSSVLEAIKTDVR